MILANLRIRKITLSVVWIHVLLISELENMFICSRAIYISFLVYCIVIYFACFLGGMVYGEVLAFSALWVELQRDGSPETLIACSRLRAGGRWGQDRNHPWFSTSSMLHSLSSWQLGVDSSLSSCTLRIASKPFKSGCTLAVFRNFHFCYFIFTFLGIAVPFYT